VVDLRRPPVKVVSGSAIAMLALALSAMVPAISPGAVIAQPDAPDTAVSARTVILSNERSFTRWAHPRTTGAIRAEPLSAARAVGQLHLRTEEDLPEVYLLQQQVTTASGASWVKLRIPARPNGASGWVPAGDLGAIHLTDWALRVNLRLLRATLYREARPVWSAPVGVGAPGTSTPTGHFWVRELLRVPCDTIYGPFAFGTSDYSVLSEWPRGGVIGIHGTNQPGLIPGRPSHGCIRMRNRDIVYLAHHLPLGAPIHIVG
jgi:lipoprotein-anchoring transpeptidase ErfK/SrfK